MSTEDNIGAGEAAINEALAEYDSNGVDPRNSLNDLTASQWIPETISVWTQQGLGAKHPDTEIERLHPAPFSFTDVARLIRFFTKRGGGVLDPFAGVGSTLKACAIEDRKGIGFELSPKYVALTRRRLETEVRDLFIGIDDQVVYEGDARDLAHCLKTHSVDFIVTSPPYWNILHKQDHKARQERQSQNLDTQYSSDPRDLGNIGDYDEFIRQLTEILVSCTRALKPRKYMALVVGDFRHGSRYFMFHADIARELAQFGLELKGITILYQRHKRVYPYGYPYAYVPNIHNQYIIVLQKVKEG